MNVFITLLIVFSILKVSDMWAGVFVGVCLFTGFVCSQAPRIRPGTEQLFIKGFLNEQTEGSKSSVVAPLRGP